MMNKDLDRRIAHIENILQKILQNTNGEKRLNGDDPVSFDELHDDSVCNCPSNVHDDFQNGFSPVKGKTVIMISKGKKKNGTPSDEMPDILKEIMGSMLGSK